MQYLLNDCPLSRFSGGLTTLHLAVGEAIKWFGLHCKQEEEEEEEGKKGR